MLKLPESLKNIKVNIKRKKIKSIILKVNKTTEELQISLPEGVPLTLVENMIVRKEKWILENLSKVKTIKKNRLEYKTGDVLNIFEKKFLLVVMESDRDSILFKDNKLYVFTKYPNDREYKKDIVNYWYREQGKTILGDILKTYLQITKKRINKFTIKTLKRNWGSCEVYKKNINLNSELLKQNRKFAEYVVLHEVAHLEHPNHSKNFYDYVAKFMPDWKVRSKLGRIES